MSGSVGTGVSNEELIILPLLSSVPRSGFIEEGEKELRVKTGFWMIFSMYFLFYAVIRTQIHYF